MLLDSTEREAVALGLFERTRRVTGGPHFLRRVGDGVDTLALMLTSGKVALKIPEKTWEKVDREEFKRCSTETVTFHFL